MRTLYLRCLMSLGLALGCLASSGCIHVLPPISSRSTEIQEAKDLVKVMRQVAPEARELLRQERTVANQVVITLDETANSDPAAFRQKLRDYLKTMIDIRNRRVKIRDSVAKGAWKTPLAVAVQQDALSYLKEEIGRIESSIQAAQNIQFRADLGEDKTFPELNFLHHQLNGFLGQNVGPPLEVQIAALKEEYRFGE